MTLDTTLDMIVNVMATPDQSALPETQMGTPALAPSLTANLTPTTPSRSPICAPVSG